MNNSFFRQNVYAVKTLWNISKRRVFHTAVSSIIGYFNWIFGSIVFMRYIIKSIETGYQFSTIAWFILFSVIILGGCSLHTCYVESVVNPITGNVIRRKLYAILYGKARNVELRCYEDTDFYNRYTMALDNADGRVNNAVASFFQIIAGVAASTVAFYAMYTIDPYSIFFVVLPILGQFVFATISSKIERKRYTENTINQRKASYVNRVLYLAEFAKEVRMSNICRLMMRRFDESIKGTHAVVDKYAVKGTLFTWIQIVITFALVFEGIMLYAAYRAIVSRTMGLAELTIMFSAMVASSWIFIGLFRSIGDLIKNCVFIGYLRDFIEYKETISEDQDGIIPEKYVNSIEFRNVSFNYKDTSAVKNISFIIKCGQTVAFTGHNGAGKSTLIKLLLRLYDPTEGTILVNGTDIKYYNLKEYRKLFAAAFQDYKIFSLPVTDNILLNEGEEETNENQVIDALSRVGIREKVDLFPKGIHTTLTKEFDEDGVVLSGGETQKIAVARALAKSAAVKVYDEPSSALDPISEYNLYTSIMSASKGQTTIFISHRLSSVSDADLVFLFEKGELIEQGCHTTLIANNKKYAEMYNMQARNYLADEAFKEKAV